MKDRYLDKDQVIKRLELEYEKFKVLYIAFDFDSTVYDYHKLGDTYPHVENLLRWAKRLGMKLILFTCAEPEKALEKAAYCKERGYEPDYINESPVMPKTIKPYYNLLLDDRAGLYDASEALECLLEYIEFQDAKKDMSEMQNTKESK